MSSTSEIAMDSPFSNDGNGSEEIVLQCMMAVKPGRRTVMPEVMKVSLPASNVALVFLTRHSLEIDPMKWRATKLRKFFVKKG